MPPNSASPGPFRTSPCSTACRCWTTSWRAATRRVLGQVGIDVDDAVGNQPVHLVLRGEIGVAGVGDASLVGPSADSRHVNVDERANLVASIAKSYRFLDVGNELELVFEQLGREGAAVLQGADIFHAVDDPKMPVIAEIAGVAGVEPAVGIPCLRGLLRISVILLEQTGRTHQDFTLLRDF